MLCDSQVISGYSQPTCFAGRDIQILRTEIKATIEIARGYEKAERYKTEHPSVYQTGLNF